MGKRPPVAVQGAVEGLQRGVAEDRGGRRRVRLRMDRREAVRVGLGVGDEGGRRQGQAHVDVGAVGVAGGEGREKHKRFCVCMLLQRNNVLFTSLPFVFGFFVRRVGRLFFRRNG